MAVIRWLGGGAPDAADWTQVNNWVGGVPVNADDVYFDSGNNDVLTNVDGQGAIQLASLHVGPGYSGSIGAVGTHLILDRITAFSYAGQGAEAWIETDSGSPNGISQAIVTGTGAGANALRLAGYIFELRLIKGIIHIDAGANPGNCPNIDISYALSVNDVELTISTGVTLDSIDMVAGIVANGSNLANLRIAGGTYTHGTTSVANVLTSIIQKGGTIDYLSTGTLTDLDVFGGLFLATSSIGFTITRANLYKQGTINLANGLHNVVATNGVRMVGPGTIIMDNGRVLTPA